MLQYFRMFACYNRWANGCVYDAASALDKKAYNAQTGAYFTSMNGTLNHLLVADRIWMRRFTGEGSHPSELDAIIAPEFKALRRERRKEDDRIVNWVNDLDDNALAGRFSYTTITDMRTISQRLAPAMAHFFNHQTHHRGQAHMILSVLGRDPPSLDLLYFQRSPEGREFA